MDGVKVNCLKSPDISSSLISLCVGQMFQCFQPSCIIFIHILQQQVGQQKINHQRGRTTFDLLMSFTLRSVWDGLYSVDCQFWSQLFFDASRLTGVNSGCSGFEATLSSCSPRSEPSDSEAVRLCRDPETWEGRRLGRSGLDTLMVMRAGRGDTDLNHTVLLGITLLPTSMATGSLAGTTLEVSRWDPRIVGWPTAFFWPLHWKNASVPAHWQVGQCWPAWGTRWWGDGLGLLIVVKLQIKIQIGLLTIRIQSLSHSSCQQIYYRPTLGKQAASQQQSNQIVRK